MEVARDFEQELDSFRKMAVRLGLITEQQTHAITFELVKPEDLPEIIRKSAVQRCTCHKCQQSDKLFGISFDEHVIAPLQCKALIGLYSFGLGQPLELEDCGVTDPIMQ